MKLVVLANCQESPISFLLTEMLKNIICIRLKPVHLLNASDLIDFDSKINSVDLIVHQPIGAAFKNFSIDKIKERFPYKTYISFPSIFFQGYWPGMMYLRKKEGGNLKGVVGDYHDELIIKCYLNGLSAIEALNFKEAASYDSNAIDDEIKRLEIRESELDCKTSEFIHNNFQLSRLFHVMNHPSNLLLKFVAGQIANIVACNFSIQKSEKDIVRSEMLGSLTFPIDTQIKKLYQISFEDSKLYHHTQDKKNVTFTQIEFIEKCFKIYDEEVNFLDNYLFAIERRKIIGF